MLGIWIVIWIFVGLGWLRLLAHIFYYIRDRHIWPAGSAVKSVEELLNYLKLHPKDLSFATYNLGNGERKYGWNQHIPRPLASTVKIIILAAYTKKVIAGELNPDQSVSLKEIRKWYLPWLDGGAHPKAVRNLKTNLKVKNGQILLQDVAMMMIRFSSNAATDYLLEILGIDYVNQVQKDWMRDGHTPIYFISGQMILTARALFRYLHPGRALRWVESLSCESLQEKTNQLLLNIVIMFI